MSTSERFSRREVLRFLDIGEKQLDYWERLRLVRPKRRAGERFYDFRDLISLRTAKQLIEEGVPAQRLRRAVLALERQLAEVKAPLTELRIVSNGREIVVEREGMRLEPLSGQLLLNFETRELDRHVRVMPERGEEDWFARAVELESDPAARHEAIAAYRRALEQNPQNDEALANLGALLYERAELEGAAECFRRAAQLQPGDALAYYNLGSVLEEAGQLDEAREHLRRAVELRPSYPDAHYNLALVCEKLGALNEARQHWLRYVELDPASPWSHYARQRLSELPLRHSL
jgi:tetratricopeptide (TPR) repeat protein